MKTASQYGKNIIVALFLVVCSVSCVSAQDHAIATPSATLHTADEPLGFDSAFILAQAEEDALVLSGSDEERKPFLEQWRLAIALVIFIVFAQFALLFTDGRLANLYLAILIIVAIAVIPRVS